MSLQKLFATKVAVALALLVANAFAAPVYSYKVIAVARSLRN
jgi:hypothetical protein